MGKSLLACAVLLLAGCAQTPQDPAFYQARFECSQQVQQMFPPQAPSGPTQTQCNRYGTQVQCTSTQQQRGGLGLTESMGRAVAMDDCMRARGYR